MNDWQRTIQKEAEMTSDAGELMTEEFRALVTDLTLPLARVNMSVSQSLEFGSLKIGASVTLTCDQNELTINRAGELAFHKARELVHDGFRVSGVAGAAEHPPR